MHDLFKFEQTGIDENKVAQGQFRATGIRPSCLERLAAQGISIDSNLFERRILETNRLASITHASKR
jgi:pilus assembly protein CpaF